MAQIKANGISLEYDTFGSTSDRPLLLVMGFGAQMIHWDEAFCEQLAGQGHYVIRYDNRDVGLSEKLDAHGVPDMGKMFAQMMAGEVPDAPYNLNDMAADGIGLLDALDVEQAHICGASMGGMIVQAMAINHRDRIRSMTSIMSTTGNPDLPKASPEAQGALLAPRPNNEEESVERALAGAKVTGSPGYEFDVERIKNKAIRAYRRSYHPDGVARQMAAIAASGDRTPHLVKLELPTLVIHGKADPLVPVEGGIATHQAIKGSELLLIEGMGHDLPTGAWDEIVERIAKLTEANH